MEKKVQIKLEKFRNQQDVRGLINILKDGDYESRSIAAAYLGEIKAIDAIPDLKLALNDPVKMVVLAAANSLKVLSLDPEIGVIVEKRIVQLERQEKNHQDRLQEVLATREDPEITEARRIHEILSLGNVRKQIAQEKEKSNQTWFVAATFLGLVAALSWLVKFLFG